MGTTFGTYTDPKSFDLNETFDLSDTGCYVSYCNRGVAIKDYKSDTTALVRMDGINPTKFLILNGDHRQEYAKLKNYNDCVEYFKQHLDLQNEYSENWDEELIVDEIGMITIRKITE